MRVFLLLLLFFFFFFFFFFSSDVQAQMNNQQNDPGDINISNSFRPSIAVVIGILSILFSLIFLLLMYAKFCHTTPSDLFRQDPNFGQHHPYGLPRARSRFSGIDKTAIESLPFFRFSSLKGSKEGLECAVCLSKFEDAEILRLLPKCKHAFHIDCVDRWLESHSSCPLCRYRVDVDDLTIFTYSNSLRRNPSDLREDPNLELFVQRESDDNEVGIGSSRFSVGGSFRKLMGGDKAKKKDELLIADGGGDDHQQFLHKFKHRILFSDVVFKNRWSDFTASDLMFLNSEMLNAVSSKRFDAAAAAKDAQDDNNSSSSANEGILKIREEMEMKRSLENKISRINRSISVPSTSDSAAVTPKFLAPLPSGKRSMSEITNLSRFPDSGIRKYRNSAKEDKKMRLWLPIARRTVQWFAGRERRSQSRLTRTASNV